jgi:hypothetical protein
MKMKMEVKKGASSAMEVQDNGSNSSGEEPRLRHQDVAGSDTSSAAGAPTPAMIALPAFSQSAKVVLPDAATTATAANATLQASASSLHRSARRCRGRGCACPDITLPMWLSTLIPFHFLEFCRTFIFFTLITSYETESTYLQMTLTRIVLVFAVSVLATTLLKEWVGITATETAVTLHPINLLVRSLGVVLLVVAILALKGLL